MLDNPRNLQTKLGLVQLQNAANALRRISDQRLTRINAGTLLSYPGSIRPVSASGPQPRPR